MTIEDIYFSEDDLAGLDLTKQVVIAWRSVQRCLPLYTRARWQETSYANEMSVIDRALHACRRVLYGAKNQGAIDTAHRLTTDAFLDMSTSAAGSIMAACSQLCWPILQEGNRRPATVRQSLNNTLEAAHRTSPGLERLIRDEITGDLELYKLLSTRIIIPNLEMFHPLWSASPPNWFLDPHSESLLWSFDLGVLENQRRIVDLAGEVGDDLLKAIQKDPLLLHQLHHRKFEELVARLWEGFGFDVVLTKRTRDLGRDVIAVQSRLTQVKYIIECKKLAPEKRVDIQAVRALWWVKQRDRATKAILATTGRFARDTQREFAEHIWELELRDFDGLVQWLHLWEAPRA